LATMLNSSPHPTPPPLGLGRRRRRAWPKKRRKRENLLPELPVGHLVASEAFLRCPGRFRDCRVGRGYRYFLDDGAGRVKLPECCPASDSGRSFTLRRCWIAESGGSGEVLPWCVVALAPT